MAAILVVVIFINAIAINAFDWQIEPESLTRGDRSQAIGYYNSTIFVIGGYRNPRALIKYDIETKTIITNIQTATNITTEITCAGQAWTQKEHVLYIIPKSGTHLTVYNMDDNTFTIKEQIPKDVGSKGCMVTYDMFIFVLGGYNSNNINGFLDTTQIFNISSHQWMNQTSTLTQKKNGMACVCHDNTQKIYVFGGYNGSLPYLSSIETLSVNDMDNINKETWILYSNILNPGRWGARAVIWGNDIIIIGGWTGSQSIQQTSIFHTTTNTISLSYYMTIDLYMTAALNVYNTIYTFGGWNGGRLTTIQSNTLGQPPTTNPTEMPT
eukprot:512410_1